MFSNLSNREKILITVLLIAVISSLYYFYIYQPTVQEISQLKKTQIEKEKRLSTAISFAKKLPSSKEEYNLLLEKIKARGNYLKKDKIDLLVDFRKIIKGKNLELLLFRPKRDSNQYRIQANIDGSFEDLCLLLEDFEKWNYWFEFKEIEIEKSKQGVLAVMNIIYHDQFFEGGEPYE